MNKTTHGELFSNKGTCPTMLNTFQATGQERDLKGRLLSLPLSLAPPLLCPGCTPLLRPVLYFVVFSHIWQQILSNWFTNRPDDGGNDCLWSADKYLLDYTAQCPRRLSSFFTHFDSISNLCSSFFKAFDIYELFLVWSVCPILLGWMSLSRPCPVIPQPCGNLRLFLY